jgi:hypothetical protein
MHEYTKLLAQNLLTWKLMLPKADPHSRNEDTSPQEKGSTASRITFAFTVANLAIGL